MRRPSTPALLANTLALKDPTGGWTRNFLQENISVKATRQPPKAMYLNWNFFISVILIFKRLCWLRKYIVSDYSGKRHNQYQRQRLHWCQFRYLKEKALIQDRGRCIW